MAGVTLPTAVTIMYPGVIPLLINNYTQTFNPHNTIPFKLNMAPTRLIDTNK